MTLTPRPSTMPGILALSASMRCMLDDVFLSPFWAWDADCEVVPSLDLITTADAVIAKMALPGVKPEDIDVSVMDRVVTIRGSYDERAEQTAATDYLRKELSTGAFCREFAIPVSVKAEAATASFKDGLLVVNLPKAEEARARHVKVQAGS
jgi:HSP20 family protein